MGVNCNTPEAITVGYNGMFNFGEEVVKVANAQIQDYLQNLQSRVLSSDSDSGSVTGFYL